MAFASMTRSKSGPVRIIHPADHPSKTAPSPADRLAYYQRLLADYESWISHHPHRTDPKRLKSLQDKVSSLLTLLRGSVEEAT